MRTFGPHSALPTIDKTISGFLEGISRAHSRVLMLDYDGTLAPFCIDPERATPYPEIPPLLSCIMKETDTRLIVVSGRPAATAARLLGVSDVEVWGCHGLERLSRDGSVDIPDLCPEYMRAIADAAELLAKEGLEGFTEHKLGGIAVHWRGREVLAGHLTHKVMRVWSAMSGRKGIRLVPFDGGIEIAVAARNKGDAVKTVLTEMGAGAAVAYLGDDTTDEDAFAALHGHGLNVLVRDEYRKTQADVWIRPPDDVECFLSTWIVACKA